LQLQFVKVVHYGAATKALLLEDQPFIQIAALLFGADANAK